MAVFVVCEGMICALIVCDSTGAAMTFACGFERATVLLCMLNIKNCAFCILSLAKFCV